MKWQIRSVLAGIYVGIATYFFLLPAFLLVRNIAEPGFRAGAIPPVAWNLSRSMAPRYAAWATRREHRPDNPETVSGTEWPLFGSVFYLSALEALQGEWQKNPRVSAVAPAVYSRPAIEATINLVTDPKQARWVQQCWGDSYLHRADLFYRYLLISSMASYTHLTGNQRFVSQLQDQAESLSAEIDHSPHGLLDDYPGQCYPTDVISALGAIKRADTVLHSDHHLMIARALRGFTGAQVDAHGMPPYQVVAENGRMIQAARGCGNSFALASVRDLWPKQSAGWYTAYVHYFWQEDHALVGFREFAKDTPTTQEFMDVDSGPVVWNFGVASSAFGVAAARTQGDLNRAVPLTAEMLVASWPLPDGSLLMARLLSDATDAPYVGEAGILYSLTRPVPVDAPSARRLITPFVGLVLAIYVGLGALFLCPTFVLLREAAKRRDGIASLSSSEQEGSATVLDRRDN